MNQSIGYQDTIQKYWNITKQRLDAAENALRLKTLEIEKLEASHAIEIKVLRDKINVLLVDHAAAVSNLKTSFELTIIQKKKEFDKACYDLQHQHTSEQQTKTAAHDQALREFNQWKIEREKFISDLIIKHEQSLDDYRANTDRKMDSTIHAAEDRCQSEIHAVCLQRDMAMADLIKQHEKSMDEAKEQFSAKISAQLDLIADLKHDIEQLKQEK